MCLHVITIDLRCFPQITGGWVLCCKTEGFRSTEYLKKHQPAWQFEGPHWGSWSWSSQQRWPEHRTGPPPRHWGKRQDVNMRIQPLRHRGNRKMAGITKQTRGAMCDVRRNKTSVMLLSRFTPSRLSKPMRPEKLRQPVTPPPNPHPCPSSRFFRLKLNRPCACDTAFTQEWAWMAVR